MTLLAESFATWLQKEVHTFALSNQFTQFQQTKRQIYEKENH